MLIDAGSATKRTRSSATSTASIASAPRPHAGRGRPVRPRTSTSCSPRTCTSITPAASPSRDAAAASARAFPRAQYIVRRGEWEDATHPHERNRASYLADNFVPLADAGVLQLVDDDQTIMPGVRVERTGGPHGAPPDRAHRIGGKTAAFVADLMPTTAHVPDAWIMGYDLYPMDTLAAKKAFVEGSDRARDARLLRARSGGGQPATFVNRTANAWRWRQPAQSNDRANYAHRDRHHRRQRPVRHGGADRPRREDASTTPFGDPSGAVCDRHAARQARRVSARATASGTASCRPSSTSARTSTASRCSASSASCRRARSAA